jgi:hypothetical protein
MECPKNHLTLQQQFVAGNFEKSAQPAAFSHANAPIASTGGFFRLDKHGRLIFQAAGYVKFASGSYCFPGLENEVTLEGLFEDGLRFEGRPNTKFHLADLAGGVEGPELSFWSLDILEERSCTSFGTAGYVDSLPHWLWESSKDRTTPWVLDSDIATIKGSQDEFGYFLEIIPKSTIYDSKLIVGASLYSLSLMAGHRIEWICFTSVMPAEIRSVLLNRSARQARFYPLFDFPCLATAEVVFPKALCHFCENPTSMMPRLMGVMWDFTQGDFEVQALLLGMTIEGIAKEIIAKQPRLDQTTIDFKERVQSALEKWDPGDDGLVNGDKERLIGIIREFNPGSTKRFIQEALVSVGVTPLKDDLKSWSDVRNRRGHGNFAWDFPSREALAAYLVCVDLANNLCLGILKIDKNDAYSSRSAAIKLELEQKQSQNKLGRKSRQQKCGVEGK